MNFSELTKVFKKLEKTSSRLEMTDIVSEFLKDIPENLLPTVILFLKGSTFPSWSEKEIGIGSKLMIQALSSVSGMTEKSVEDILRERGDSGIVAEQVLVKKPQTTLFKEKLTVEKVYDNLDKMVDLTGKGSQEKKIGYISELLSIADPGDSKYVVRLILGELRLGVGDGIIRDAIAKSFNVDSKLVENAYYLTSDLGEVARIAKKEGSTGLNKINLIPGHPIMVMLAQKAANIEEILSEFKTAAFEIKYDGARLQIHKKNDMIELFTRRLENVTKQFPEVVKMARENIKTKEAIVEGEMVAIRSLSDRRPRPFQDLSRRIKRKYDIDETVKSIPVELNLFDIIYIEGKSLLSEKFKDRRKILEETISATDTFMLSKQLVTDDLEQAKEFYQKALDLGHEGVMVKNLDAHYRPGSRVGYMYKIKPVMETLDLVITGATWGEGRRAHWMASFLLSVIDKETGEFLNIGRMGTGLTDEQFKDMTERLKPLITKETGKEIELKPEIVVEVAYEEIQKSPTYSSGYALRFPRLVRIREDKGVNDADTVDRVQELISKSAEDKDL